MKKYGIVSVLVVMSMIGFTVSVQADIPRNGLVAEYLFNGNADDTSGNRHDGTVNGATLTTDRFGNTNSSYNFIGSNFNNIKIDNNSDFQFGNGEVTVSAWFKAPPEMGYICIVGKQSSDYGEGGLILRIENGKLRFFAQFCGSSSCGYNPLCDVGFDKKVDDNIFHHVVGVRLTTGELKIYLDGTYVSSNTIPITDRDVNNIFFSNTNMDINRGSKPKPAEFHI